MLRNFQYLFFIIFCFKKMKNIINILIIKKLYILFRYFFLFLFVNYKYFIYIRVLFIHHICISYNIRN